MTARGLAGWSCVGLWLVAAGCAAGDGPAADEDAGGDAIVSADTADEADTAVVDTAPPYGVGPCEGVLAEMAVAEGREVLTGTRLHLAGRADCEVTDVQWEVRQPPGSQAGFSRGPFEPEVTFTAEVAGTYTFRFTARDDDGGTSVPAETTVAVRRLEALRVELTWRTPNDPNETDEGPSAGSDLDLHLLRPGAVWFDPEGDCYGRHSQPNWGSLDPTIDDDPQHLGDDVDGAGPEAIIAYELEAGDYRVGVHVWDDHAYGPSVPTIRIVVFGEVVRELVGEPLYDADLWEVGTITWPEGTVSAYDGPVIHEYPLPWAEPTP